MEKNKNNKPAAPAAPTVEAEAQATENAPATQQNKTMQVINMTEFMQNMSNVQATEISGIDPNRRVDLHRILHETFRMDPKAAEKYHMSQETVDKINNITAIGQLAILACEVTFAKNPFALIMNKAQLNMINELGSEVGLSIDMKSLPAPDKDGNIKAIAGKTVTVDKESQKKIKSERTTAEKAIENNPNLDPTKVKNEDELKESIIAILVKEPNGYSKISNSINFMRTYMQFKNKDNAEELEKAKNLTNKEILVMIKDLVGPCPFVLNSLGHHMFTQTSLAKSPIPAFCMFRNASKNRKTGVYTITDREAAEYTTIIVTWAAESCIAKEVDAIANIDKNLIVLNKDKKKNAKAIEEGMDKKTKHNNTIEHYKKVLEYINNPSSDVPSTIISQYKEKDPVAGRIFNAIVSAYLSEYDLKTVEPGSVYHNIEQYAGIIHNLFRDPMDQLDNYSIAKVTQLIPTKEEEDKAEESKTDESKEEKPETTEEKKEDDSKK